MAGGPSVGEVSVRVMPDTSGVAEQIRRDLAKIRDITITVNADLDDGAARAGLARLGADKTEVSVGVDLDNASITKAQVEAKAAFAELSNLKVVKVDADISSAVAKVAVLEADLTKLDADDPNVKVQADVTAAEASIAALRLKIATLEGTRVKLDIDADAAVRGAVEAKAALDAIPDHKTVKIDVDQAQFAAGFSGILGSLTSAFENLQGVGSRALSGLTGGADGLDTSFIGVAGTVTGVATGLVKATVGATAIAEAGAAITAAYGAASTAIAAVPAAIGLIGAPLAAVKLGVDGIKAAAKSIEPQFKSLQKTVSAAFQTGLTPVLKNLATNLFPQLGVGLSATAAALSAVAANTANWVTSQPGIALLSTTIGNINTALTGINLVPLVSGFVSLAGNKAALDLLVTTVNGLGTALDSISKNTDLEGAFNGLKGVVSSLETAFTGLVNNGITLFRTAAPGAQAAIDGIGQFFSKFNWATLGSAVSDALRGVGTAVGSIPQSTVNDITTGFQSLGTTLSSPEFAQGVRDAATLIPLLTQALKDLIVVGEKLPSIAAGFLPVGSGFIKAGLDSAPDDVATVGDDVVDAARKHFSPVKPAITTPFANLGPAVQTGVAPVVPAVSDGLRGIIPAIQNSTKDATAQFTTGFGGLVTGAQQATAPVPGVFQNLADLLVAKGAEGGSRAGSSLGGGLNDALGLSLKEAAANTATGFVPVQGAATTGTQGMVDAVNAAIPGLGTAFQTGFTALTPLVTTSFAALGPAVGAGLALMSLTITSGFAGQVGPAFTTGFATLAPIITAGFTALGTTGVAPGLALMALTITTGMAGIIGPAFTTGFATLGPIISAGFLLLGTTGVAPGLALMALTITTGMAAIIGPAFTAGFATLGPIISAGFLLLGTTGVTPGLALMALTITTGFAAIIGPAFTAGFVGLAAIVTAGFVALAATAVTPGMVAIAAAVTAGFVLVNAAITAGFVAAQAAFTAGFTAMTTNTTTFATQFVQIITKAMTDFTTAVKNGMTQAVAAVKAGTAAIIAALNAAASQAQAAGVNLGKAFVAGIKSQESAARAAGAALGKAAADGLNSTKGISAASPSRKGIKSGNYLGIGFINAVDGMVRQAAASGANLGSAAADALQDEMDRRFSDIAANFSSDVGSKLGAAVHASVDGGSSKSDTYITLQNILDGEVLDERTHKIVDNGLARLEQILGAI